MAQELVQPERFEYVQEVRLGESLLAMLERLLSVRLIYSILLAITETFFFKDSKVHSYYSKVVWLVFK